MGPTGGEVRMRGPLGISRVARTRVVKTVASTTLHGAAELGRRTHASVRWDIAPRNGGSDVTFSAFVDHASLVDRVLLALGGRWWLARVFARAVERLGVVIGAQPLSADR